MTNHQHVKAPSYGNLASFNTTRLILDSVGEQALAEMAGDYLDQLGTSIAIYERNGDYALGILSSGWCRLLDQAGRKLCLTDDNRLALQSGKWLCHESCWTDAAKVAIETGQPVDVACRGGLRLYALPIMSGDEVVGAISFGYGQPPTDKARLQELAGLYGLPLEVLAAEAEAYPPCSQPLLENARKRLQASARLIGALVANRQAGEVQGGTAQHLKLITDSLPAYVAYVGADDLRYRFVNKRFEEGFGIPRQKIAGSHIKEIIGEANYLFALPHIEEVRKGGASSYENSFDLPQGKRWVRVNYVPGFDKDGQVVGIVVLSHDITESKKAEEERDALLRSLNEAQRIAHVGSWDWSLTDGKATWSEELHRIFGRAPEEGVLPTEEYRDHIHPDDQEMLHEAIRKSFETGRNQVEFRFRRSRDNSERVILATGEVSYDSAGNPRRLFGTAMDITERKRMEEELRGSRQFLSDLIENSGALVFVKDSLGRYELVNRKWEEVTGLDRKAVLGRTDQELFPGETGRQFRENDMDVMNSGKVLEAEEVLDGAGGKRYFISIKFPLYAPDGTVKGICGMTTDITGRKKAEDMLRINEQRYKSAQRMGQVGNWEYDLLTGYFWGSDEAKRIYGFNPRDDNFTTDEVENCIPDREMVHQALVDLIEKDKPYDLEFEIQPLAGAEKKVIKSIAELVKDDSGRPTKVVGVIQDVTERLNLEKKLRQSQRLETVGTLAGGIAHDFNNILAAIMGYAEIALDEAEQDKATPEKLKKILHASGRAKSLIQRILTFSRRDKSEQILLDLNKEILVSANLLKQTLPKMIDIHLDLSTGINPVMTSPHQVEQIIMNLGTNARDAMPEGGSLSISTSQQRIEGVNCMTCSQAISGEYIVIEVNDTGQGIREEDLDKIFDPFFTTKEVGKGTGLGLSTIFGIVNSYGGHINCSSEIGKGTSFKIYLPPAQGEIDGAGEGFLAEAMEGGHETILLVDDEVHILDIGTQHLARAGYRLLTAHTGEEALEVFRAEGGEIDLVILDLSMPGMGGHKCLQALLALSPDLKIIVATGYSRNGDLNETMSSGAAAMISKPFSKNEMLETVRSVLNA